MVHETGHYDSWNPFFHGHGPQELETRQKYLNLWHGLAKIMWSKSCRLLEEHMFFNHEAGTLLLHVVDLPSVDERWKKYPAPKDFPTNPTKCTCSAVVCPQEHTTFYSIYFVVLMDSSWPQIFVRFILNWAVPEIVKRMLCALAKASGRDGSHFELIQRDSDGIYAEAESLVQNAQRSSDGTFFSAKEPVTFDRAAFRATRLTEFEARNQSLDAIDASCEHI